MSWLKSHTIQEVSGTLMLIYAQPGASRTEIRGLFGDPARLKVAVQRPPVEGAANRALVEFFSRILNIARSQIHLVAGESSRQKSLWFPEKSPADFTKIVDKLN